MIWAIMLFAAPFVALALVAFDGRRRRVQKAGVLAERAIPFQAPTKENNRHVFSKAPQPSAEEDLSSASPAAGSIIYPDEGTESLAETQRSGDAPKKGGCSG